jgi:hypothetical protein
MKISIETAVFGLVPVPMPPDEPYGISERPRIARQGATCKSITRARMRYSPHAFARRTTAISALPRARWHRRFRNPN